MAAGSEPERGRLPGAYRVGAMLSLSGRGARWSLVLLAAGAAVVPVTALGGSHKARGSDARPRCFGAAARDPEHPCHNRKLRLMVVPTPREARRLPNAPCRVIGQLEGKKVCDWGVPAEEATATVALVGDSHAGMWRAAVTAAAVAQHWRGISIGHASCPLSKAVRNLPEPTRSNCARWKRAVYRWFAAHPEVSTVFTGQLSGGSGVVPRAGRTQFETEVAGYIAAWKALPPTVRHIVVIRDSPKARGDTDGCVTRAIAARRPAGPACAARRSSALDRDPAFAAAARLRSRRVQTIDLTPFFCSRRFCYPVVGGALVQKDATHLTATFVETLGPYMLRAVERLTSRWDA